VSPEDASHQHWEEPNVVLVVDRTRAVRPAMGWLAGREQPGEWALPEDELSHRDAMVTKAEVRALVLARLGPRLGDLVWDIGAGSGSVAVECARLGAAVVAVEKGPVEHLQANASRYAVDVAVVQGEAPSVLQGLPDPDAVFVGGGGADVGDVVRAAVAREPRVVVVALATLDRVADVQRALSPYRVDGVQLQVSRLRALGDATGLQAGNPVFVLWGHRP
jgi:precorrin-6Y C5,15-methyltransferase (decarboxylating)